MWLSPASHVIVTLKDSCVPIIYVQFTLAPEHTDLYTCAYILFAQYSLSNKYATCQVLQTKLTGQSTH